VPRLEVEQSVTSGSSAIVTVAFGHSTEHLDHTFSSFGEKNPAIPLHAFIIGADLPRQRLAEITYHLVAPVPDFLNPRAKCGFGATRSSTNSTSTSCSPSIPMTCFAYIASHYIPGQGYTGSYLNGGVTWWNLRDSRDIRADILERGRSVIGRRSRTWMACCSTTMGDVSKKRDDWGRCDPAPSSPISTFPDRGRVDASGARAGITPLLR
jgi:hypothetical protein